jgi:death-on-curing family protein
MRQIFIEEAEYIAHRLAKEMLNYDEPISDFTARYPHKLESCLAQPFQRFDGKDLYPTLLDKTSLLFYLIIKNHPFENGNKRLAVTIMICFLFINDKWITITPEELYKLAYGVAESDATKQNQVIKHIKQIIGPNIIDLILES